LLVPLEFYCAGNIVTFIAAGFPILAVVTCILIGCFKLRKSEFGILLSLPLSFICLGIILFLRLEILQGVPVMGLAGPAAPLLAIMLLSMLAVLVMTIVVLVLCVVSFPRKLRWDFVGISLINSATLAFTLWSMQQAIDQAEDQQIISLRVVDRYNQAVVGASVIYRVYAYGYYTGGRRPERPTISGGPILTNDQGVALIRSKRIRYEVEMGVTKSGYVGILAHLQMQFYEGDKTRLLQVRLVDRSYVDLMDMQVSSTEPVVVTLSMPLIADRPQPMIHKEIWNRISKKEPANRFLDVLSGKFTAGPKGDLRFDFINEHPLEMRVTALNGNGIVREPDTFTPDAPAPSYAQIMHVAPNSGYSDHLDFGWTERPLIYFKRADGNLYARLALEADLPAPDQNDLQGHVHVGCFVNPTGSPNLLFEPALEIAQP